MAVLPTARTRCHTMLTGFMSLLLAVLSWTANAHPALSQSFSNSEISIVSGAPVAGEIVSYQIDLTHSGAEDIYAEVTLAAPGGVLLSLVGDCSRTTMAVNPVWVIRNWSPGQVQQCFVDAFTYNHSAGSNAVLHADIRTGATFHRVESSVPLAASASGQSGVFTPLFLALGAFTAIVWAVRRSGSIKHRRREQDSLLLAAIGIAFLGIFLDMAHEDWRAAFRFQATQCRVLGTTLDIDTSAKNHRFKTYTYSPQFALAYEFAGKQVYSSGFATQSSIIIGGMGDVTEFPLNGTVPCRFDPEWPKTVVVKWSPGLAYLFSILPLGLIVLAIRLRR